MLEKMLKEHEIHVESVINFRDLGGLATSDGYEIKRGLLFRSGPLDKLVPQDADRLHKEFNITQVVDFRTAKEREAGPDMDVPGATNTHLNVYLDIKGHKIPVKDDKYEGGYPLDVFIDVAKRMGGLRPHYVFYGSNDFPNVSYRRFLDIIYKNESGGTLWHCTQGKDRTGIAAAYILTALGVDRETILDEYETTNVYYSELLESITKKLKAMDLDEQVIEDTLGMFGVNRAYLKNTFRLIEEYYGSVDEFIRTRLGISDKKRDILRMRYLK